MKDLDKTPTRRAADLVVAAFARIDAVALGCAFGLIAGLGIFTATMIRGRSC